VWEVIPSGLSLSDEEKEDLPAPRRARTSKPVLPGDLVRGWLAFQWDRERRRLAPVPPDWASLDDGALTRLLESAAPAGKPRRLIE